MFALYARYYAPAHQSAFIADLEAKTHAVMLRDSEGALRGFSTIRIWRTSTPRAPATFLYSGDTIIERAFWGSHALPFKWIEFAGAIKAAEPARPLYWLLISKGHRTYRLLPAFARRFYPTWRHETPDAVAGLMDFAGQAMFGERFDREAGIVRHMPGGAALLPEFGEVTPERRHPDISYFHRQNPAHGSGDELLCLCELNAANLQPMARTQFLRGFDAVQMDTVA